MRRPSPQRGGPPLASGGEPPSHLFVLVHGLQGQPGDLSALKEALLQHSNRRVAVHLARSNTS